MTSVQAVVIEHIGVTPSTVDAGQTFMVSVRPRMLVAGLYTAPAVAWTGTGPYAMTIATDGIDMSSEAIAYVDHNATLKQRMAEYNGLLQGIIVADGQVQLKAHSVLPKENLPIRVISGPFPYQTTVSIPASAWTGTGPWMAAMTLSKGLKTAVCGATELTSTAMAEAIGRAGIHVCSLSGFTIVFRAMIEKPTSAITIGVAGA